MGVRDGFCRVFVGLFRMYSRSLSPIWKRSPFRRLLLASALVAGTAPPRATASAESRRLERINRSVVKIYKVIVTNQEADARIARQCGIGPSRLRRSDAARGEGGGRL